jgi:hypothetical protein
MTDGGSVAQQPKRLARHPKCSALFLLDTKSSTDSSSSERYSTVTAAAPSVSYLSNMTIDVTSKSLAGGPQYAITVHDRKSSSTWRYLRSYDQCRGFQQRLLSVLQRGHFCFAECPWLYTFIKRIFPKPKLFKYTTPKVVESRRFALSRFFLTLQAILVNPMNQSCGVLSGAVANEVVGFLTNHEDSEAIAHWQQLSPASIRPLARTFSESFMSLTDDLQRDLDNEADYKLDSRLDSIFEDDAATHIGSGEERFCCAMCALHSTSSDEQIFASWQATTLFPNVLRVPVVKTQVSAPHQMLSPLDETAVLGWQQGDRIAVLHHDGTPKEAYPFDDVPSSPSGSSVYDDIVEIDISLTAPLDMKMKEAAIRESAEPASDASPRHEMRAKLAVLPRRSLQALQHVTHALCHKLTSPHVA